MEIKEHKGFFVGEKVICILNNRSNLTVGKEYVIEAFDLYEVHLDPNLFWITVKNDHGNSQAYYHNRFMGKGEFRKYLIDDILK